MTEGGKARGPSEIPMGLGRESWKSVFFLPESQRARLGEGCGVAGCQIALVLPELGVGGDGKHLYLSLILLKTERKKEKEEVDCFFINPLRS